MTKGANTGKQGMGRGDMQWSGDTDWPGGHQEVGKGSDSHVTGPRQAVTLGGAWGWP